MSFEVRWHRLYLKSYVSEKYRDDIRYDNGNVYYRSTVIGDDNTSVYDLNGRIEAIVEREERLRREREKRDLQSKANNLYSKLYQRFNVANNLYINQQTEIKNLQNSKLNKVSLTYLNSFQDEVDNLFASELKKRIEAQNSLKNTLASYTITLNHVRDDIYSSYVTAQDLRSIISDLNELKPISTKEFKNISLDSFNQRKKHLKELDDIVANFVNDMDPSLNQIKNELVKKVKSLKTFESLESDIPHFIDEAKKQIVFLLSKDIENKSLKQASLDLDNLLTSIKNSQKVYYESEQFLLTTYQDRYLELNELINEKLDSMKGEIYPLYQGEYESLLKRSYQTTSLNDVTYNSLIELNNVLNMLEEFKQKNKYALDANKEYEKIYDEIKVYATADELKKVPAFSLDSYKMDPSLSNLKKMLLDIRREFFKMNYLVEYRRLLNYYTSQEGYKQLPSEITPIGKKYVSTILVSKKYPGMGRLVIYRDNGYYDIYNLCLIIKKDNQEVTLEPDEETINMLNQTCQSVTDQGEQTNKIKKDNILYYRLSDKSSKEYLHYLNENKQVIKIGDKETTNVDEYFKKLVSSSKIKKEDVIDSHNIDNISRVLHAE